MGHTYSRIHIHLIWATKRRTPWLDAAIRPRLFANVDRVVRNRGGILLAAGGVADHVHLYVAMPVRLAISDLVAAVKANSSRWIHTSYPERAQFAWQGGYAAFSVNPTDDRVLREYIRDQEMHHAGMPFTAEYLALLKRHGIAAELRDAIE